MSKRLVVLLCGFVLLTLAASVAMVALDTHSEHGKPEPPMAGVRWAKGQAPGNTGKPAATLSYHGGPIMTSAAVTSIFWGPSWNDSAFAGDKMSGLDTFYEGIGGSHYIKTNVEYTDGSGAHVGSTVTSNGHLTDLSAAANGSKTTAILAEVCKKITTPVSNGYYPVYVDVKRGTAGFCAWHSYGTCAGVQVQFAFFFNLDGDAGCDPGPSGSHSQGLDAVANVSGHEISEAITDPILNAWYDRSGAENSDKCAWTFGSSPVQFSNNSSWKIQGNWSNAAYNANQTYAGGVGPKGCIDNTP